MGNEIKAVLFDMDGTLVDSTRSLQYTMNQTMKSLGLPEIGAEQVRKFVGNGTAVYLEKTLQFHADRLYKEAEKWEKKDADRALELDQQADELMEHYDEALETYMKLFSEYCTYEVEAYPGLIEALESLKSGGKRLACITNKPKEQAQKVIDSCFPAGMFHYLSADDGSHPLKPNGMVVTDTALHLGVKVENCVMVGDTRTDMQTAKAVGIPGIGCLYGFRTREELLDNGADMLIERPSELPDAVDKLSWSVS